MLRRPQLPATALLFKSAGGTKADLARWTAQFTGLSARPASHPAAGQPGQRTGRAHRDRAGALVGRRRALVGRRRGPPQLNVDVDQKLGTGGFQNAIWEGGEGERGVGGGGGGIGRRRGVRIPIPRWNGTAHGWSMEHSQTSTLQKERQALAATTCTTSPSETHKLFMGTNPPRTFVTQYSVPSLNIISQHLGCICR
jgi:hypothetical protein